MSESFDALVRMERDRLTGVFQQLGVASLLDYEAAYVATLRRSCEMSSSMVQAAAIYNSTRRGMDYSERLPLRIVNELNAAEADLRRLRAQIGRPDRPWWKVLGLSPGANEAGILSAFRRLAKGLAMACHPHPGGSLAAWDELLAAREQALASTARLRYESECAATPDRQRPRNVTWLDKG